MRNDINIDYRSVIPQNRIESKRISVDREEISHCFAKGSRPLYSSLMYTETVPLVFSCGSMVIFTFSKPEI